MLLQSSPLQLLQASSRSSSLVTAAASAASAAASAAGQRPLLLPHHDTLRPTISFLLFLFFFVSHPLLLTPLHIFFLIRGPRLPLLPSTTALVSPLSVGRPPLLLVRPPPPPPLTLSRRERTHTLALPPSFPLTEPTPPPPSPRTLKLGRKRRMKKRAWGRGRRGEKKKTLSIPLSPLSILASRPCKAAAAAAADADASAPPKKGFSAQLYTRGIRPAYSCCT